MVWVTPEYIVLLVLAVAAYVLLVRPQLARGRVGRSGLPGRAKVLSSRHDIWGPRGAPGRIYHVVWDVSLDGQPTFRAKGRESMDWSAWQKNHLGEGATYDVRCDPAKKIVVLERVPTESLEDQVTREAREAKEKERALLGGRPPPRS